MLLKFYLNFLLPLAFFFAIIGFFYSIPKACKLVQAVHPHSLSKRWIVCWSEGILKAELSCGWERIVSTCGTLIDMLAFLGVTALSLICQDFFLKLLVLNTLINILIRNLLINAIIMDPWNRLIRWNIKLAFTVQVYADLLIIADNGLRNEAGSSDTILILQLPRLVIVLLKGAWRVPSDFHR